MVEEIELKLPADVNKDVSLFDNYIKKEKEANEL